MVDDRGKRAGHGMLAGEPCGVVRGRGKPCEETLRVEPGDRNEEPRCRLHCRQETRNAESVSALCPQWRMRGRTRCARHGGRSRAGALAPSYRHGRFSQFAPQRMGDWIRAVAQGDVLDLTDDINVMGARIAELLQNAEEGGSAEFVKRVKAKLSKLFKLVEPSLTEEGFALVSQIKEMVDQAARDYSLWDEIQKTFRDRIKAVESQRKRAIEGKQLVPVDDVMKAFVTMGQQLKEVVEAALDKETADRLLTEVNRQWTAEADAGDPDVQDETAGSVS